MKVVLYDFENEDRVGLALHLTLYDDILAIIMRHDSGDDGYDMGVKLADLEDALEFLKAHRGEGDER